MAKRHLKRLNAPKRWPIKKKTITWITRPNCGPHKLKESIPLGVMLKEILQHAKTTKEVKRILHQGQILVNKKVRRNIKFPAGLMDVIEIPLINQQFRILLNKRGKFILHSITKEESEIKPFKIIGKKTLKNKKTQLKLYDGTNTQVETDTYKTGDTIIINLTKKEITKHIKLEKDAIIYITGGKQIGTTGTFETIHTYKTIHKDNIKFKTKENQTLETLKDYAFVIGKEKPEISLPEEQK